MTQADLYKGLRAFNETIKGKPACTAYLCCPEDAYYQRIHDAVADLRKYNQAVLMPKGVSINLHPYPSKDDDALTWWAAHSSRSLGSADVNDLAPNKYLGQSFGGGAAYAAHPLGDRLRFSYFLSITPWDPIDKEPVFARGSAAKITYTVNPDDEPCCGGYCYVKKEKRADYYHFRTTALDQGDHFNAVDIEEERVIDIVNGNPLKGVLPTVKVRDSGPPAPAPMRMHRWDDAPKREKREKPKKKKGLLLRSWGADEQEDVEAQREKFVRGGASGKDVQAKNAAQAKAKAEQEDQSVKDSGQAAAKRQYEAKLREEEEAKNTTIDMFF